MQITIWWDAQNNPTKPWCYEISFFNEIKTGECQSLHDCWREFEAAVLQSVLEDRVVDEFTQDNQPSTRH